MIGDGCVGSEKIKHKELSYQIVGAAQRAHSKLGPGFPEAVYHKAMCVELMRRGIAFESEKAAEVYYEDVLAGQFRLDLLVDDKVAVELKALSGLSDDHLAQVLSYLKATGKDLGILINFGRKSLETKRVVL